MKFPGLGKKKDELPPPRRITPREETPQNPQLHTYRRGRTMTDRSSMPEVSERARIHHVRRLRRKVGIGILIVLVSVVLGGICVSQYSGSVKVVTREPSLVKPIDDTEYNTFFKAYYKKHPFERFRFATDYPRLAASMQQDAPEVKAIIPSGMERLGVSRYELVMRKPVASWVVDSKQYYVDSEGVTFTKNYYEEPTVAVTDNSGAQIAQGSAIASSRLLSFVGRIISLAADRGIKVESIEIPPESMRLLYVKGEGTPVVRMAIDRDVEVQANDMSAAVKYLQSHEMTPGYIDVRVEGKAFYQ